MESVDFDRRCRAASHPPGEDTGRYRRAPTPRLVSGAWVVGGARSAEPTLEALIVKALQKAWISPDPHPPLQRGVGGIQGVSTNPTVSPLFQRGEAGGGIPGMQARNAWVVGGARSAEPTLGTYVHYGRVIQAAAWLCPNSLDTVQVCALELAIFRTKQRRVIGTK